MGNMITRRPDLFGAVCCAVPLLDMHRYHTLLAGASWMAEYGDPSTSDWSFLQQYSAYHNISPSGARTYPPLLMTTSTRDDRVHPYHARAFSKRLVDAKKESDTAFVPVPTDIHILNSPLDTYGVYYYENIEGGHGGAADNKQQAFMNVSLLIFPVFFLYSYSYFYLSIDRSRYYYDCRCCTLIFYGRPLEKTCNMFYYTL